MTELSGFTFIKIIIHSKALNPAPHPNTKTMKSYPYLNASDIYPYTVA